MTLSLQEHAQILKEVGMSSSSSNAATDETIKVVLLFPHSARWEKLVQRAVDGWLTLGRHVAAALIPPARLLMAACPAYLVLYGTSQLIVAIQSSGNRKDDKNSQ